ncbi:MAG: hypothetical protein P4N60_11200 [Verrucomicrobiae bacterium]|nr:hypothetical protein [Verrucomicrobiae bacterium]
MSCYRCGKELPEGQVECEGACNMQQAVNQMLEHEPAEVKRLVLGIELFMDQQKVRANPEAYALALEKFNGELGKLLVESGVIDFMLKKQS